MRLHMSKKKIAFVLTTFTIGGVERSFLDLLRQIDRDRYEVIVFLPDNYGKWTSQLFEECDVRLLKIDNFKTIFFKNIHNYQFYEILRSIFFRFLARLLHKISYRKSYEFFMRSMAKIKEEFDCVIAYQIINDECVLGSLYRIHAPKKIAWSHSDINKTEHIYEKWYGKFDKIFCVSYFSQKSLIDCFPALAKKTEVFHNIIDVDRILLLANQPMDINFKSTSITLLTVARLEKIKGQMIIPTVAKLILNKGYDITWYLIGDGDIREDIICEVKNNLVEENVILLGSKNNPYPYIKYCDIYVQTSIIEGWGLTVSEAKVLQKPIVTTAAGVMSEQIENGINGIIVAENSASALADGILRLIEQPDLMNQFSLQLKNEDVGHYRELKKLYAVFDF